MEKSLILTGFMGAGKTSVARILSQSLGLRLVDLDQEIEARAGCTIAEIFEMQGEGRFRELETEALGEMIAAGGSVIATGGGVLTRPENLELMRGAVVVNLDASFETLYKRIRGSERRRPLLRGGEEKVRALFEARRPLYDAVKLRVDTEGLSAMETAARVSALYADRRMGIDGEA